jgi:hypothetical protein
MAPYDQALYASRNHERPVSTLVSYGHPEARFEVVEQPERRSAHCEGLPETCLTLIVESFGRRRRRKLCDARTRGLRAVFYGDLVFGWLWMLTGAAEKRTLAGADRLHFDG